MKKHPFLKIDYQSTVRLTSSEKLRLDKWLFIAGNVAEELIKDRVIAVKKISTIQVSMLICGDVKMRELNRQYRNKDKVTDVLSFPAWDDLRTKKYMASELFLGDLAICHPQTKRQAHQFKISYYDEFIHLFFHGLLHLMGYDHELSAREEKLMEKWETKALDKFSEFKKGSL